jgi:hypothetical protein
MQIAFKLIRYSRRVAKQKGFSDNLEVIVERLAFAKEEI